MNTYPSKTIEQSGIHKEVVCKENGRIFHLTNNSNSFIQKIKIDGALITTGIRCDYAVDVTKDKNESISDMIYLIELKGSDKAHACKQIIETYNYFQNNYNANTYNCRIVLSKDNAPKVISTEQKKLLLLQKQRKLNLLIQSQKIEEVI